MLVLSRQPAAEPHFMTDNHRTDCDRDTGLENFAAELTGAVYPLLLRRGLKDSWLEVELGLWRALAVTVNKWAQQRQVVSADEFEAWRKGLLGTLTGSALSIALNHGIDGPHPEVESSLYGAFRQLIER
jgi:hypothetical protein